MKVTTNHVRRDLLYGFQLTEWERKEFDYLDSKELENSQRFFRFKGLVYDLHEFVRVDQNVPALKGWTGYQSDTYFSGVVVKYLHADEQVVVGQYFS